MTHLQLIKCRTVRCQSVRCDTFGLSQLIAQKALYQLQSRLCIPPSLNDDVKNLALIINRTPQLHKSAADFADHFIEMPTPRRRLSSLLQTPCDQRPKLDRPAPDRFVADIDSALRHQFLDIAKTEIKAKVQPLGMADQFGWKPVTLER